MDQGLCYVREDYTLEMALAVFLRTGAVMALVVNRETEVVGLLLLEYLVLYLLGREVMDSFEDDNNIELVAKRRS